MANTGGNTWSVTTNASAGTLPQTYDLRVKATDIDGNSSTSVSIPLTVMKNGDVNGNDAVNIADAMLLGTRCIWLTMCHLQGIFYIKRELK
jgi:hypothetical protein